MKVSALALAGLAVLPFQQGLCFPGMKGKLDKIEKIAHGNNGLGSTELLGDLLHLPDKKLSHEGKEIKSLLQGGGNPESNDRYYFVPPLKSRWCRKDTCCVWKYIAEDLEEMFRGNAGRCTSLARQAIRMGFHDAGCWCKESASEGGGADGSLVLSDELSRVENTGMQEMGAQYRKLYSKYHKLGFEEVTMADLIQMGSNIATVTCPLGPRVRSFVGRKDNKNANLHDLLPSPFADAETLIEIFRNKTISPRGLVALLGAHTVSQQNVVNVTRAGDPQDSTPGVWDKLYFEQTLGQVDTPDRVYSFPSDLNLAQHPTTKPDFEAFAGRGGERSWNQVSSHQKLLHDQRVC